MYTIAAVQSQFSLFARDVLQNDENAAVDELGIGVVAFSPRGRGTLTSSILRWTSWRPRVLGEDCLGSDPRRSLRTVGWSSGSRRFARERGA